MDWLLDEHFTHPLIMSSVTSNMYSDEWKINSTLTFLSQAAGFVGNYFAESVKQYKSLAENDVDSLIVGLISPAVSQIGYDWKTFHVMCLRSVNRRTVIWHILYIQAYCLCYFSSIAAGCRMLRISWTWAPGTNITHTTLPVSWEYLYFEIIWKTRLPTG